MTKKICAIVITYNRKPLLQALLSQTLPVSEILIVDNASTDGTRELFDEAADWQADSIRYVRLEKNGGGAGGFHRGMELVMKRDCDWFWLMELT